MATITLPPGGSRVQLDKVRAVAEHLLKVHGLAHWQVVWTRAKRTAGTCDHANETLRLSAPLMSTWEMHQCEDTILHEIAHALTKGHGHDRVWKRKCVEIGADPTRTWGHLGEKDVDKESAPYVGTCPNGHKRYRYRKPNVYRKQSCGTCAPRFDEKYLITWRKRA